MYEYMLSGKNDADQSFIDSVDSARTIAENAKYVLKAMYLLSENKHASAIGGISKISEKYTYPFAVFITNKKSFMKRKGNSEKIIRCK